MPIRMSLNASESPLRVKNGRKFKVRVESAYPSSGSRAAGGTKPLWCLEHGRPPGTARFANVNLGHTSAWNAARPCVQLGSLCARTDQNHPSKKSYSFQNDGLPGQAHGCPARFLLRGMHHIDPTQFRKFANHLDAKPWQQASSSKRHWFVVGARCDKGLVYAVGVIASLLSASTTRFQLNCRQKIGLVIVSTSLYLNGIGAPVEKPARKHKLCRTAVGQARP